MKMNRTTPAPSSIVQLPMRPPKPMPARLPVRAPERGWDVAIGIGADSPERAGVTISVDRHGALREGVNQVVGGRRVVSASGVMPGDVVSVHPGKGRAAHEYLMTNLGDLRELRGGHVIEGSWPETR